MTKNVTSVIENINKILFSTMQNKGVGFIITDVSNKYHELILIEPHNYTKNHGTKYDGMCISYEDGIFEVLENQAGDNEDELHIFLYTKSFKVALNNMLKGNKRKPIKIYK